MILMKHLVANTSDLILRIIFYIKKMDQILSLFYSYRVRFQKSPFKNFTVLHFELKINFND